MGLAAVEIVLEVEDVLGIKISDADAAKAIRVIDLVELAYKLVLEREARQGVSAKYKREKIRLIVREIVGKHLGVEDFPDEASFVQDLRLD